MAQQPSRTITTQPEYQGPLATSFQASNDDAMSTALSMPPNTGVTPQADSLDPILSQSLPPVSAALQQCILRVATSTPSPNASHPSPRITSFSTWLDAWNIYIATIVAHNPATALELLEYQHLIHSATFTWLKYKAQFGTLAASNPLLRWDSSHSELRLDSLAIQTGPSLSARTVMPVGRSYVTSLHQPDQVLTIL